MAYRMRGFESREPDPCAEACVILPRPPAQLLALALSLLVTVGGCRGLVNFERHEPHDTDAAQTEPDAVLSPARSDAGALLEPKPSFLSGATCETCMADRCGTQADACQQDSGCRAFLLAARSVMDPVAWAEFWYRPIADVSDVSIADYLVDTSPVGGDSSDSDPLSLGMRLRRCVTNNCSVACQLGHDFACLAGYDWPVSTTKIFKIRAVDALTFAGIPDCDIAACQIPTCTSPLAMASTDARGIAEFKVTSPQGGAGINHLQIDCGSNYEHWVETVPDTERDESVIGVLRKNDAAALYTAGYWNRPFDPERAYYMIFPYDCRQLAARNVTLEVDVWGDSGLRPCADCARVLYTDDNNLPAPSATDTSAGRIVFVGFVPTGPSLLVVRDARTRTALAATTLVGVAGSWHTLQVFPASRSQLQQIPDGLP